MKACIFDSDQPARFAAALAAPRVIPATVSAWRVVSNAWNPLASSLSSEKAATDRGAGSVARLYSILS
jgi:hypothetical protein